MKEEKSSRITLVKILIKNVDGWVFTRDRTGFIDRYLSHIHDLFRH